MRRLLAPRAGWSQFTPKMLLARAESRLRRLEPGRPLGPEDEHFLAQLVAIARSAAVAVRDPSAYQNPWPGIVAKKPEQAPPPRSTGPASTEDLLAQPQYFFSGDGALAFLLVRPAGEKDALIGPHASVEALRGLVEKLRPDYRDLEIGLTGLPV